MSLALVDEARLGQQGTLTRIRAKHGTRPRAPRDQRCEWAYISGAVCPERCTTAAIVMPCANAGAMSLHLAETGRNVAQGAHAAVIFDGAGYHIAAKLLVPANITLIKLPPHSPELNPVENIRACLRANKLANTVHENHAGTLDKACQAWMFLDAGKDRIASLTKRDWQRSMIRAAGIS